MPRFWEFQLPTRIHFGRGGLRRLAEVVRQYGNTALLVGYREAPGLEDAYARAVLGLEKAEVAVTPFRAIEGEPSGEAVEGARQAIESQAKVVVALGGGSVIDAAKGIAALARAKVSLWDHADANPESRPVTKALPVIAVPTTAGTGSEATSVAVFTFHGRGGQPDRPLKSAIYGPALTPKAAVIDPDLTLGMSPSLTAASAADALGHALEATISRRANPLASMLAARAIALIVEHLPQALAAPDRPEPREALALAATLAGAAFNEAGVTVGHALAHALGAIANVPHAVAVAIATPVNLRYNAAACSATYADLAAAIGIGGSSLEERAGKFVERIEELLRSAGLPDRAAIPADAPADQLDRLVENAQESTAAAITLNPRKVDAAALRGLFAETVSGMGE
jgi:alcohol dehydrogenase class IV